MANKNDTLFSINAGQLLAILHLASKDMYKGKILFYNSGITGNDTGTPKDPKDCMFDLKNKEGLYELACDCEDLQQYNRMITTDEVKYIKDKAKKLVEASKEKQDNTNKNKSDDAQKKYDALSKQIEKYYDEDENKQKELELYKQQNANMIQYNKNSFVALKTYMENFCGKDNAAKIKESEVVKFYIPEKIEKYQNYKIPFVDQQVLADLEKKQKDQLKKAIDDAKDIDGLLKVADYKAIQKNVIVKLKDAKVKLAYKIGFSVEVETM